MAALLLPAIGQAAEQVLVLSIQGMTCPLCVAAVNKALRSTPGVLTAKTNLGQEQAQVTIQEGTDRQQLLDAVESAGYVAKVLPQAAAQQSGATN